MSAGSRSAARFSSASRSRPGKSLEMAPAPELEAPPGSQLPSGERWEYTTPAGSLINSDVTPLRTRVVPSAEFQLPTLNAPAPICAAQPSVMPAMTGVPFGTPVCKAAFALTTPRKVPARTTSGKISPDTPSVANTSSGHRSLIRSTPVFSALLVSVATSAPTNRRLIKSVWCARRVPAVKPPCWFNSQSNFGNAQDTWNDEPGRKRGKRRLAGSRDGMPPLLWILFVSRSVAAAGQFVRTDGQRLTGAGDNHGTCALSAE